MNKQIEKLMNKARALYRDKDLPYEQGLVEYSEKFAELIVKECCNVVDYDNAQAITNHFGNKEEPPVVKSRDLMKGVWKV
jgi:hypothetical protein